MRQRAKSVRTLDFRRLDRQIIRKIAKEMGESEGEIRRLIFGRRNGRMKWEDPKD